VRAVVVGAGIGGLGAAIALERAGVEPIVIERAPELREAGFGLVVAANAVTALRSLGLREAVAARGTRVRRAEIRNPRGDLLTRIDYEALRWETYGILRAELQQAMLEAVPAARLRLGTTCLGATEDGHVALASAETMVGDIVVGADGVRSAVRRSLFGEETLRYGGHRAWRAGTRFDDERVRDRFVESGASAAVSASALPAAAASTGTSSRRCPKGLPRRNGLATSSLAATAPGSIRFRR
jgi:2-polyprenyl-6-methoxyphenol hydroxylase-like FAD-dependent oxidoreductase